MNAKQLLLRGALVLSSVSLASAYVYSRSGGRFFWQDSPPPPAPLNRDSSPGLLPGSKSAVAVTPHEAESSSPPTLLPGSKSLILSEPLAPAPQTAPAEQSETRRQRLLPGSKSQAVDFSE